MEKKKKKKYTTLTLTTLWANSASDKKTGFDIFM